MLRLVYVVHEIIVNIPSNNHCPSIVYSLDKTKIIDQMTHSSFIEVCDNHTINLLEQDCIFYIQRGYYHSLGQILNSA